LFCFEQDGILQNGEYDEFCPLPATSENFPEFIPATSMIFYEIIVYDKGK